MPAMAKISISLEDHLYDQIRDAAGQEGVSSWLAAAAAARLRREAILEVTDEIARERGRPFTEQELQEAREWLRSSSTLAP